MSWIISFPHFKTHHNFFTFFKEIIQIKNDYRVTITTPPDRLSVLQKEIPVNNKYHSYLLCLYLYFLIN